MQDAGCAKRIFCAWAGGRILDPESGPVGGITPQVSGLRPKWCVAYGGKDEIQPRKLAARQPLEEPILALTVRKDLANNIARPTAIGHKLDRPLRSGLDSLGLELEHGGWILYDQAVPGEHPLRS